MVTALALAVLVAASPVPRSTCAAAAGRLPEGVLSGDVLPAVKSYRRSWREFCSDRARRRSLAPLLDAAEALAKAPEVLDAVTQAETNPSEWLPALAADDETDSLFVRYTEFAEVAVSGSQQDRAFFPEYVALGGDVVSGRLPPWIGYVEGSGYATCLKLGEVDWLGIARRLEALRGSTRTATYRKRVDALVDSVVETLDGLERGTDTCGCTENPNVLEGLDALVVAARTKGGSIVRRLAAAAESAGHALRTSAVVVRWDRRAGQGSGGCQFESEQRRSRTPTPARGADGSMRRTRPR